VDRDEFGAWYRGEHRRVVASLVALSGRPDAARDATDEAFVRALAGWDRVGMMASPAGWVYRVALNELRRTLRRRSVEARLLGRRGEGLTLDALPSPELWAAVRALPRRQRIALVLRVVADLSEADVAVAMGVDRSTVSSTLVAARRSLGRAMAEPVSLEVLPCTT
jgi:RNA polymerase sigma factor (sigma-70 family)